jgi:hypothetical protein
MSIGFWLEIGRYSFVIDPTNWGLNRFQDKYILLIKVGPFELVRYTQYEPEKSAP